MTPPETHLAEREYAASSSRGDGDSHDWRRSRRYGRHDFVTQRRPRRRHRVPSLRTQFTSLADQWEQDTAFESVTPLVLCHPSYLRVIALGPRVIPLILDRMQSRPAPWFAALEALTGVNPGQGEDNLADATRVWLDWGRQAGFVN